MNEPASSRRDTLDWAGAVASTACAVHCALVAILPGAIAALGLTVWLGEGAEWLFSAAAVFIAGSALILARRRHRSPVILVLLTASIAGLLLARYLEEAGAHGTGAALGIVSSLGLVAGHVMNLRAVGG